MPANFVYLASASPRRRALLEQIGVRYQQLIITLDETPLPAEPPDAYVARLAGAKAEAGWRRRERDDAPVLAADTAVVLGEEILGKPKDREDAERMLLKLAARTHLVLTAAALRAAAGLELRVSRSAVTFRAIEPQEARAYWDTGEPADKAGGYAVQGAGAIFVAELRGSFSGVMGLPLYETAQLLRAAGVPYWRCA